MAAAHNPTLTTRSVPCPVCLVPSGALCIGLDHTTGRRLEPGASHPQRGALGRWIEHEVEEIREAFGRPDEED